MSQANVDRIKAGFAAHNRGDIDALVELYHPDAVFETLLLGTHHGKEAIRRLYEENQANQSDYKVEPVEMIDAGDKVVSVVRFGGAGPVSQIELADQIAFVHTLEDGLVVREQTFSSREDALEAAGLPEPQ